MTWTVTYHPALNGPGIVETMFAGTVNAAELRAAATESLRVAREHESNRMLADCTTLLGGHSVFDLYQMAELVASAGLRPVLHEAVLVAPDADMAAAVDFWRTAATNRGMVVRVFQDRAAALAWLRGPGK